MKLSDNEQSATGVTGDKASRTVLLADDSEAVHQAARDCLESEGYTVMTAADGFDAVAQVVEFRPALVLVDIMMPRLDGYQVCSLIKNNGDFRHIPVVMLSSQEGLFDKARGRIVGSDGHLPKPFNAESLLTAVRRYLANSSPATAAAVSERITSTADKPAETSDA